MLQVRAALSLEIDYIVQRNGGLFPARIVSLAQPNVWRHDGSIEPYIYRGVIAMPTLRRIRLEVGNYEFSFSHPSVILEK